MYITSPTSVIACCAPLVREPMDAATADDLARKLKALADPARLRLLSMVASHADGGPTSCQNLCCLCRRHHRLKTHAPGGGSR